MDTFLLCSTECRENIILNLFAGPQEVSDYSWKWLKGHFTLIRAIFKEIQFKKHYTMGKSL